MSPASRIADSVHRNYTLEDFPKVLFVDIVGMEIVVCTAGMNKRNDTEVFERDLAVFRWSMDISNLP